MPEIDPAQGFLARLPDPPGLPSFVAEEDFAVLVEGYRRTGFGPGLNLYRNLDRNWALLAPWHQAPVTVPSLFIAGSRDTTIRNPAGQALARAAAQRAARVARAASDRRRRPLDPAGEAARSERRPPDLPRQSLTERQPR
ncbi:MAG: hypothetical protein WDN69_25760 [Aliidongia sp.]